MKQAPRNVRRPSSSDGATADSPDPPVVGVGRATTAPPPDREPSSARRSLLDRSPRVKKAVSGAKVVAGVAIVVSASLGVAWGAKRYMTTSPRFSIKSVVVEGNQRLTPQDVARRGEIVVGENVFSLDLEGARRAIQEDPWVKSASVTRKLPGSVMVTVVEHEPVALVAIDDKLFLASREGDVFKEALPDDPLDLPVITGIDVKEVQSDRAGVQKSVLRALDVVEDLQKTTIATRYPLQEVHLVEDGTIELVVGRDAIAIHLGLAPFRGKLEQAERVFAELGKRKTEPTIMFLDNESSPDRIVVRLR
jgi:cell division protein FtsQ